MIHLEEKHLAIVRSILSKHLDAAVEVLIFGSRVTGKHKPFSDLDLCLKGQTALDLKTIASLNDDFEDSDLPIRIDLVDWNNITPEFQKIISNQCEQLK
ncbi:MAG: nucleotidyltransferase domain-containing protein [Deltaproteobacteria bacterium]|nr:nucleotidyltransferase domain-containing protein [Deltaproteobacteria bacterium]